MAKNPAANKRWRTSDELWERVEPLLPKYRPGKRGGRPRVDRRRVFDGILYVLRTGCQWKMIPPQYSSGSTCHRRFQSWVRAGIFERIWRVCLRHYDDLKGIDWRFQSLDGAIVSAPVKGGIKPAKTLRIAANSAPSGTCSRMRTASRWRSRSRVRTGTT